MKQTRRKLLSQNFLHSRQLAHQLVSGTSIGQNDLVLEIGPGRGIITQELINQAGQVVAVELDHYWYTYLNQHFKIDKLILYHQDFLQYQLPHIPYKVFANPPFAIEGKIIRHLIDSANPPDDCYLVIDSKLAHRLIANNKPNMFSILHSPWFDFDITHHFKPTDFTPVPNVNPTLFRFTKKPKALLPTDQKSSYQQFIMTGFGHGQFVSKELLASYPKSKVDQALHCLSISRKTKPSHLSLSQWLSLHQQLNLSK